MREELEYCLPDNYQPRLDNKAYRDLPSGIVYQPHVYDFAIRCARLSGASRIIDIGCGSGEKLAAVAKEFNIIGVDAPEMIDAAQPGLRGADLYGIDLNEGLDGLTTEMFDDAVVICADVIEHLRTPEHLVARLAEASRRARFIIISTPDRERARGLADMGPPLNEAHVREWTAGEFRRFLTASGFPDTTMVGWTVNNNVNLARATIVAISGRDALPVPSISPVKVMAIIHVYNEVDMIEETISHLSREGVDVIVVDNWSTDGSYERVEALRDQGLNIGLHRFPNQPSDQYEWAKQLALTETLAQECGADWVMHYDADELRVSPWRGVTLAQAFAFIGSLGYNAVDFTVAEFRFLKDRLEPNEPYEKSLTHFEFAKRPGCFLQIKGWQQGADRISLSNGGHTAEFPGRKLFPLKFLNKHYPLRSRAQGARKVHLDRLPRFASERQAYGWHSHYDHLADTCEIEGWDHRDLVAWNAFMFETEFLIERLTGIGLNQ